jgi:O-antigen/teichoic acid export membrane protein
MVTAAGNKMTMAVGGSEWAEANRIYQTAQLFMTIICCSLATLLTPIVLLAPLPDYVLGNERITLVALLCGVLLGIYGGLPEAMFRATGRYATGTMLSQFVRLGEFAGFMFGLYMFRTFVGVALTGLVARTIGTAAELFIAHTGGRGLRLGFQHASKAELSEMIRPAVSLMAFPLASALTLQGMTLIVGLFAGTAAVALFNAYRTIARIAVQSTAIFSYALAPEFARLFGQGGMTAVHPLFRRSAPLSAAQSIALSLVLYFVSPFLLRTWTHGRIEFMPAVMAWLLAYAAVGGIWHVPRILLIATNQHIDLAGWSLAAGVLAVALAWLLGTRWQIDGVGAAMLISECFIAAVCVRLAQRSFDEVTVKIGSSL